jgi:hypothetical protein
MPSEEKRRVAIKSGWEGCGRTGDQLAAVRDRDGMQWAVVLWDDEEDPTTFKLRGLALAARDTEDDE